MKIKVCTVSKCKKHRGKELYKDLKKISKKINEYIEKENIDKKSLKIKESTCQHNCKHAPNIRIKHKQIEEATLETVKEKIFEKYKISKDKIQL